MEGGTTLSTIAVWPSPTEDLKNMLTSFLKLHPADIIRQPQNLILYHNIVVSKDPLKRLFAYLIATLRFPALTQGAFPTLTMGTRSKYSGGGCGVWG